MKPAPTLFAVRRGERADEVELVDQDGSVVILTGYGLTEAERARTREAAMALLGGRTRIASTCPGGGR